VLGVNAHLLILKYTSDYREYRTVMKRVRGIPHIVGINPFVISPMMVSHGERLATGVLLKGVDPELMPDVLDLPKQITEGSLVGLRRDDAKPPEPILDALRRDLVPPRDGPRDVDGGGDPLLAWIARDMKERSVQCDAGPDGAAHCAGDAVRDGKQPSVPSPTSLVPKGEPSNGRRVPARATMRGRRSRLEGVTTVVGDVTPQGGYKSLLPDDDFLPDSINPDQCKSSQDVANIPGIVVGRALAQRLDVGVGDCVQVTSPQIGISFGAAAPMPIAKQFRVIALFEAGFDQYDSRLVYTDLYEAQAFYEYGDSVTGIEMKLDDIDRANGLADEINKVLNNGIYYTVTWMHLNRGLFTALLIQQIGMSFALGLIVLVAACTVISTLIMVVLEKKKEIALLKAIGAKNGAILRIFLYQGCFIGLAGTGLGVLIGWLCCRLLGAYRFPLDPKVYFISRLPVSMHPIEFVAPALVAIGICLVATIIPALYAARLRPADGLRT
jgi:lipoprotein-releasing system permease protein